MSVSSSSHIPQSLNISADGDLASKLARLAGEADCIKQKMSDTGTRHAASSKNRFVFPTITFAMIIYASKLFRSNVFQKSSSVDCESNKRR